MTFLVSLVSFIAAIALLVAIHEYGHFFAARRLGIQVLRFSIGFGRPLWSRRGADGVEYVVGTLPLGGYVKMLDERDAEGPLERPERAFNRQPVWKRAVVLVAGPLANLLFAVAAYWAILVIGVPGLRPIVGPVTADSPAAAAGIRVEDEFVTVAGDATPTWEAAALALLDAVLAADGSVAVEVRGTDGTVRGARLALDDPHGLTEPGEMLKRLGLAPWSPPLPAVLGEVPADGPAGRAGLRVGDRVVAIDGIEVADWREAVKLVRERPGKVVPFRFERDGMVAEAELALDTDELGGRKVGRFGAAVAQTEAWRARWQSVDRSGPLEALPEAVVRTRDLCVLTVKMMWRMLTGGASLANISGPINIAQYAGVTATISPVAFLGFLAVISVSLGVLNLLPVPILDGGQLVFLAVETAQGRPVSPQVELVGQQVGIVLLVGLMGLAFYNDVVRLIG